ncbi:MAG: type II CAAX endopeptidase family protein [Cyanobacteria bacterium P01_C01_bin.118]
MHQGIKLYRRISSGSLPWRLIVFFCWLLILWAPLALLIYGVGALLNQASVASTVAVVFLYLCFVVNAWVWGRWSHGWRNPFSAYGLVFNRPVLADAIWAMLFGVGLVAGLFGVEVLLGWASFQPKFLGAIALEGLAVGLGIGFAEELLFRGWLLAELDTGLSRLKAIVWSSLIFAVAHFIKPLPDVLQTSPQFIGLLLLGIILAIWRYGRCCGFPSLGLPIGLHSGLVWGYYIVDVADLVTPSEQVPEWVTGIHGNPLSGLWGLTILSCLVLLSAFRLHSE